MRQLLKSLFAAALPKSLLLTHGRVANDSGIEIALTFDDGPHPEHTPRLLDVLAEAGVRGTFFVVGERAEQLPELVRRIADEGHELGNHTWTHSEPSQTSAARFLEEVARTRRLIQDLTISKALGLWRQQQTITLWNIDPKDFAMTDESAMTHWLNGFRPQSGDVVLLHDNHSRAAVAVEQLATNSSLRFVTLSDWLHPAPDRIATSTPARELEVADAR
ncbi:MAG: polysaccharide deacetylase [Planctomycetota bacterium]|nr:MAG: polysaccharide deacetylase [Planctomycetota bacterium]